MWGKVNILHLKRGQVFSIMSFIGGSTAQLNTWLILGCHNIVITGLTIPLPVMYTLVQVCQPNQLSR